MYQLLGRSDFRIVSCEALDLIQLDLRIQLQALKYAVRCPYSKIDKF